MKLALYEKEKEVVALVFDGKGSDKTNWFSRDRVLSIPWVDLIPSQHLLHFSIEGFTWAG